MNENKYGSRELPPQNPKSPKYGQTVNVRPLTANRGFQFTARWLNLDLKSIIMITTAVTMTVRYTLIKIRQHTNQLFLYNLYMKLSTKYNLSKEVIRNTTYWHINA